MDGLTREIFAPLEVVCRAGDPGVCAYVIEEGCVEVLRGEGGDQILVAVLSEGAMFGEVALLDRQPRTATIRALVPTRLVRIERDHVEELLLRADPVIQHLLRSEFPVTGKSLNKDEFVTCGGVRLNEIHFKTMESRTCPGLFFAGELLNLDGITGGFNFQAAWTTGWLAGRAMAGI